MTWNAVPIGPEAPLAQAAALMLGPRVGSLAVGEAGRLVDPDTYLP